MTVDWIKTVLALGGLLVGVVLLAVIARFIETKFGRKD